MSTNKAWIAFPRSEIEHHAIREHSTCPGFNKTTIEFIMINNRLPEDCEKCYKILIFWKGDKENVTALKKLLAAYQYQLRGKYNNNVVVIYVEGQKKFQNIFQELEKRIPQYNVRGKLQWRIAGRYWQNLAPHLFKSAKELV